LGTPWAENTTGDRRGPRQFLDEHRAQRLQAIDDVAIVDDLVAHIDRRAEFLDGALDDLDGPIDARAEAARAGEHDGERRTDRHRGVHGRNLSVRRHMR
jgi:hypothetical protein